MRGLRRTAISAIVVLALGPVAIAQAAETTVVSRAAASGPAADGVMKEAAISADGRFVAFVSTATNLGGPTDGTAAVYLKDTQTGELSVVSRAFGGAGALANASSSNVSISSDGRYVAFASTANNLGAGGPLGLSHVYVRDTVGSTTTAVDRATGTGAALGGSDPVISGNGEFVAFEGLQDSYSGGSTGVMQVYLRDLNTNATTLVSRANGTSGAAGNADSGADADGGPAIAISPSGRFVVFVSMASNLTTDANPTASAQVFQRDTGSAATTLISRFGSTGNAGDGNSSDPTVATDGTVAFTSQSTNLGGSMAGAFVRPVAGATTLVSRASGLVGAEKSISATPGSVAISADGSRVAWVSSDGFSDAAPPNVVGHVHIRNVVDGSQQLADVNSQGTAVAAAAGPVAISSDGSHLAFMASPSLVDPTAGSNVEVLLRYDIPAPTASITAPADTSTYQVGQVVHASYSCTEGAGAALQSCLAPVANGSPIDTSRTGSFSFTVVATDTDGQTGSATARYTVIPARGASMLLGLSIKPRELSRAGRLVKGKCVKPTPRYSSHPECKRKINALISFSLSGGARVQLSAKLQAPGRKVAGGACVKPTKSNAKHARCLRWVPVNGGLTVTGVAGSNSFEFHGELGGRRLEPATYELIATVASGSKAGAPRTVKFRIVG